MHTPGTLCTCLTGKLARLFFPRYENTIVFIASPPSFRTFSIVSRFQCAAPPSLSFLITVIETDGAKVRRYVVGIWTPAQMFCTSLRVHDKFIQRSYVSDRCVPRRGNMWSFYRMFVFLDLVLIHIYNPGKGVISWLQKHRLKRFWKSKDAGIRPYQSQQTLKDHKANWPWWVQCYQQAAISLSTLPSLAGSFSTIGQLFHVWAWCGM